MPTKKLRYVPGLISLIGLPILFFIFNPQEEIWPNVVNLNLPYDDTADTEIFSKAGVDSALIGKTIEKIYLGTYDRWAGSDELLNQKIDFIAKKAEELQFTSDTTKVLQVVFSNSISFGNYMSVLDIALAYKFHRFAWIHDNFYFFPNDPPALSELAEYNDNLYYKNDYIYEDPEPWRTFYWRTRDKLELLWLQSKNMWLLSIGFLILIITPSLAKWLSRKFHKPPLATS